MLTTLTCSPLGRPLQKNQVIDFSVVLATETLNGNEGSLQIQMALVNNNPDANTTLFDNSVNVTVNVTAVVDINVDVEVYPEIVSCIYTIKTQLKYVHMCIYIYMYRID